MITIGDIIFALVWSGALIFGIKLMANGWSLMSQREWEEEWSDTDPDISKMINESTHPEMKDIKFGDEVLIVNFKKESDLRSKLDSPVLHETEGDPLYKSLQSRIDILREENKKDDEEKDDDGGSPVVSRV